MPSEVVALITHDLAATDAIRQPSPIVAHIAKSRAKGGNMIVDPATTSQEHYTPQWLVDAVWDVMGRIDLDPASCSKANAMVEASVYHGADDALSKRGDWSGITDGLVAAGTLGWHGNIFLNPPGGYMTIGDKRVSCVPQWWRTLVQQWQRGNVEQAIFLAFNMNVFRTAQSFADVVPPHMFPFCVPSDRICFDRLNEAGERVPGKQPPQDSAIIYLPPTGHTARDVAVKRFERVFGEFGAVRV
jgi:hypothetical protein